MNRGNVTIQDRAARQQEGIRIVHAGSRQVTETHEVAEAFAAIEPVLVKTRNGQRIGYVNLLHEDFHLVDDVLDFSKPLRVDRGVRVKVDRAGCAANHEVGMRVLAAEDRMQACHIALPLEGIKIVRDRHQVCFWRQLVFRVTPVRFREDTELTRFNKVPYLLLHIAEVAFRRTRIAAQRGCQCGRCFRISTQCGHDIHPVQRMQMIEVHDVVVDVLRADHQVTNQFRIRRNLGAYRVLNRTNRCHAVHQCAHPADTLSKRPGITRIAVPQDDFDTTHHRAGRIGLPDLVAIHLRLDTEVSFDACDGINYNSRAHDVRSSRFSATVSIRLPIV